jgi:hypothetical protein
MEGKECLLIIFEKFWVKWDWKEANLPEWTWEQLIISQQFGCNTAKKKKILSIQSQINDGLFLYLCSILDHFWGVSSMKDISCDVNIEHENGSLGHSFTGGRKCAFWPLLFWSCLGIAFRKDKIKISRMNDDFFQK